MTNWSTSINNRTSLLEPTSRIQILDDITANQIAAGEVIERPSAVVKELVENALDADAKFILVELEDGGKQLIRVTDDGCGMSRPEAILAFQRHATSKIRSSDDLFRVITMGFRGEALPSIGSVSQMTLVTKQPDDDSEIGTEIHYAGGELGCVTETGVRTGTCITVENLFYNVPARLKFLKTSQTELNHSLEILQRLSLAYPEVSIRLVHQGTDIFSSAGTGSSTDAAVCVFGRKTTHNLAALDFVSDGISVKGFIGTPEALKSTRASQHIFVNRRFVRNKAVTRAIDEAYKSVQTLHGARYPAAAIFIEVDPSQVDVNVSPTKTEVRFTREREVYSAVYHSVQNALMAGGLVGHVSGNVGSRDYRSQQTETDVFRTTARPNYHDASILGTHAEYHQTMEQVYGDQKRESGPVEASIGSDYRRNDFCSWKVLAQTRKMYILAQTENALVLIDQHIAHERVIYEKLIAAAEGGGAGIPTQRLVIPFTIELSRREALVVADRLDDLRRAGFDLEAFGGNSYAVRSIPASVAQNSLKNKSGPEETLLEIIDELVEKTVSRRLLLPSEEVLITASCKMAVKAGDVLTNDEMEALLRDLLLSTNPYTCPHGRPIIVELPNVDLDRKFGR